MQVIFKQIHAVFLASFEWHLGEYYKVLCRTTYTHSSLGERVKLPNERGPEISEVIRKFRALGPSVKGRGSRLIL